VEMLFEGYVTRGSVSGGGYGGGDEERITEVARENNEG